MQISTRNYYKPTPAKIRKAADAISGSLKVVGASSIVAANPIAGLIIMIIGEAIKIASNFFIDDKEI